MRLRHSVNRLWNGPIFSSWIDKKTNLSYCLSQFSLNFLLPSAKSIPNELITWWEKKSFASFHGLPVDSWSARSNSIFFLVRDCTYTPFQVVLRLHRWHSMKESFCNFQAFFSFSMVNMGNKTEERIPRIRLWIDKILYKKVKVRWTHMQIQNQKIEIPIFRIAKQTQNQRGGKGLRWKCIRVLWEAGVGPNSCIWGFGCLCREASLGHRHYLYRELELWYLQQARSHGDGQTPAPPGGGISKEACFTAKVEFREK